MSGTDLAVEHALGAKKGWRKLTKTLAVGAGGLVLLDAAFAMKRAPAGAVARLRLAAGSYRIEEAVVGGADDVHVLRLAPVEAPGASPRRTSRAARR